MSYDPDHVCDSTSCSCKPNRGAFQRRYFDRVLKALRKLAAAERSFMTETGLESDDPCTEATIETEQLLEEIDHA